MHLPTLPLLSNSHVYVEGDVSIDPSAAIAPGVILRAAPDSKIIIAAGVCIGMGSILQARQGTLDVEAGASLGAGVLFVGKGKIGANACVGAITTIWNESVAPWQVVPAGSVIGSKGRQIADASSPTNTPNSKASTAPESSIGMKVHEDAESITRQPLNGQVPPNSTVVATSTSHEDTPTELNTESSSEEAVPSVSGQGNLNRLLKTLFPYNNQSFNRPPEDG